MKEEKLRQEKLDMLLNMADRGTIDESFSFKVQMPYFLDPVNEKKPQNTNIIISNQTENNVVIPSTEQTNTTNQQTNTINQQIDTANQQTNTTSQQTNTTNQQSNTINQQIDTTNQQINTAANQQTKQIDKVNQVNQCNIS